MPTRQTLDRWPPANVAWHPPAPATPMGPAMQLRITLAGVHPPVWRRVHVPAGITLSGLHEIVQVAGLVRDAPMAVRAPLLRPRERRIRPDRDARRAAHDPGDQLGYVYAFGDHWLHLLELEKLIAEPRGLLPIPSLCTHPTPYTATQDLSDSPVADSPCCPFCSPSGPSPRRTSCCAFCWNGPGGWPG